MKNLRNLVTLLAVVALSSTGRVARAEDGGATDVKAILAKIDALQPTRDQAAVQKQIDELVSQAMKAAPDDFDVLWRAARHHCWVADGLTSDSQSLHKQVEGRQCWDAGAKAAKLQPERVEGNYFAANGIGAYSESVGIVKALTQGLEGKFNGFLDKAIAIDPKFQGAAPLIAKGRYYFKLPWPKRSYSKSEEMYKKALAVDPNATRAKLWLAETLVEDGNAKEAKTYLDQLQAQLAAGGKGDDPAEAHRVAGWVAPVQKKVQEELK